MKIKALVTLHFDKKPIKPGETVDIKDDEAKSLIERGFAAALVKETPKPAEPQGPTIDDIIASIDTLDSEQDFGKSGKPNVDALEAVLDANITAEQRDKAWEIYQAELKDAV